MQTPDTPQLTPIEKAIEIIKDIADGYVDEKMSDLDKDIVSALYKAVNEIDADCKPYERQYLRDVAEKGWDAAIDTIEDHKAPDKQTYLNQNHLI